MERWWVDGWLSGRLVGELLKGRGTIENRMFLIRLERVGLKLRRVSCRRSPVVHPHHPACHWSREWGCRATAAWLTWNLCSCLRSMCPAPRSRHRTPEKIKSLNSHSRLHKDLILSLKAEHENQSFIYLEDVQGVTVENSAQKIISFNLNRLI